MRADMGKVLVERPRLKYSRGAKRPRKGYRKQMRKELTTGDVSKREGIKERCGDTKRFNEHLGPLRRFLDANIGRPWNKIYSEICQFVDRGNVVQKHILTHLFDYVVVNTVLIDGEPCRGEQHWGHNYGVPLRTSNSRYQWYVCPKSGLLRNSKYVPHDWRAKPVPPRTVKLNNKQVCVERGERWELISVTLVAKSEPWEVPAYDVILQRAIDDRRPPKAVATDTYGRACYAVTRRVLSRKELLAMPIPIDWLK